MIDFHAGRQQPGDLDVTWHAGWPSAKHDPAPEIQVQSYDEHTVILRQNKSVNYEAPFLYLLFGNDRAVLIDTGATSEAEFFPLRRTVDSLIGRWLKANPRTAYGLVVVHTHAHGDHVAADGQFGDRPGTVVVGKGLDDVKEFYGLADWPDGTAEIDLGGRVVDVIPGPGHQEAATVFYDRYTRVLLTGDSFYPGRLYVFDWPAYVATLDRLLDFCRSRDVSHVLGCHIEMSTEGNDYPIGSIYQPDETPLQMTVEQLRELRRGINTITEPGIHPLDDVIVYWIDKSPTARQ